MSGTREHGLSSTVTLADGVEMPTLGLGTYKAADGEEVERAVATALEVGYRHVDTASLYGNERGVGRAIRESGVDRQDVFVTTKVWNTEQGYGPTLEALEGSLERLGLDHVDLYLVHWPIPRLMADTWRAMEELKTSGRTRTIGVCNHLVHHLRLLLSTASDAPQVDQCEFHPRLQQKELVDFCAGEGIAFEAWAPIMRGRVLDIPEIVEVGEHHGKTAAQVTLAWILQKRMLTIPKSVHEERIRENADVFDLRLTEEEVALLDSLDRGERLGPDPDSFGS